MYCYGCGQDITDTPSNRYNMFGSACEEALPIWKNLATEVFHELNTTDIDIEQLLNNNGKCIGRMCRKCPTALVKLHKLTVSTKVKLHDAVEKIMNEDRWQCHSLTSQSRKRNLSSSSDEEESYVAEPQINSPIGSARPRKRALPKTSQMKAHNITNTKPDYPVQSPDVAVCKYSLCKHT